MLVYLVQRELCKAAIRTSIGNEPIYGEEKGRGLDAAIFVAFGTGKATLDATLANDHFTTSINEGLECDLLAVKASECLLDIDGSFGSFHVR